MFIFGQWKGKVAETVFSVEEAMLGVKTFIYIEDIESDWWWKLIECLHSPHEDLFSFPTLTQKIPKDSCRGHIIRPWNWDEPSWSWIGVSQLYWLLTGSQEISPPAMENLLEESYLLNKTTSSFPSALRADGRQQASLAMRGIFSSVALPMHTSMVC